MRSAPTWICWLATASLMLVASQVPAAPPPNGAATRAENAAASDDAPLIAQAERFMEGYAAALLRGDPAEIAAYYDRDGVYEVRPAMKRFTSYNTLLPRYRDRWSKPAFFEWRDLSYEALAPDKVLVVGLFAWAGSRSEKPQVQSYVAVLRLQDGQLRVRLEAEAWQDGASWSSLAKAAAASCLATLLAVWLLRAALRWRRRHATQSRSSAT
ncbi:nuclear transport factor 2 family protein [Pseudoxanthomonas sp. PXM02]|uniref:DUF4440 domain-containing protein n=1 Tax=Pseudoxanthomonas sp. PXM02 TaxID=2769294 RepID=UPI001782F826|nr:nuclear transport factor 2 family protein [Pseudoxanthomonas sp. PXM02]MBD9479187.1 nuclear transport factor 2 family protein [Pseudoxanthomonas sp. PXM02]